MATAISHQINLLEFQKQIYRSSYSCIPDVCRKILIICRDPFPLLQYFPGSGHSFLCATLHVVFNFSPRDFLLIGWNLNFYLDDLVVFAPSNRGDVKLEPWTAIKNVPKVWIKNAPHNLLFACCSRMMGRQTTEAQK
jgi:hypothetical protein